MKSRRRRCVFGLDYFRSWAEYGDVGPFGNFDNERFVASFRVEVVLELLAKLGHMNANESVMAGIVVWRPAEDFDPYILLTKCAVGIVKASFSQIQKQIPMTFRLLKLIAGRDSLKQLP
jgi:hypothetical protein